MPRFFDTFIATDRRDGGAFLERGGAAPHSLDEPCRGAAATGIDGPPMTQTNNRILDELAKLMTDAAGAAQGMRREVETFMKTQGERVLREMDVVTREEFEATKAMAVKARDENEALRARIEALEAELAGLRSPA